MTTPQTDDDGFVRGKDHMTPADEYSSTAIAVKLLTETCKNGHIWTKEQQTGHRVCAWCNECNDPRCKR